MPETVHYITTKIILVYSPMGVLLPLQPKRNFLQRNIFVLMVKKLMLRIKGVFDNYDLLYQSASNRKNSCNYAKIMILDFWLF